MAPGASCASPGETDPLARRCYPCPLPNLRVPLQVGRQSQRARHTTPTCLNRQFALLGCGASLLVPAAGRKPKEMNATPKVDVAFAIQGTAVPLDHGYALYAAISRCVPALHGFAPVHLSAQP